MKTCHLCGKEIEEPIKTFIEHVASGDCEEAQKANLRKEKNDARRNCPTTEG